MHRFGPPPLTAAQTAIAFAFALLSVAPIYYNRRETYRLNMVGKAAKWGAPATLVLVFGTRIGAIFTGYVLALLTVAALHVGKNALTVPLGVLSKPLGLISRHWLAFLGTLATTLGTIYLLVAGARGEYQPWMFVAYGLIFTATILALLHIMLRDDAAPLSTIE
jgi:hypothetical protein